MDRAALLLKLAACIAGLRAGNVAPCLTALIDLHDFIQDQRGARERELEAAFEAGAGEEEPFIWDEPCRP